MKSMIKLLPAALIAACAFVAPAQAAPIVVGTATLINENDLTVIEDGAVAYEFLDLTATAGLTQAQALASYGTYGFMLAGTADITRALGAFGFTYVTPGAFTSLGENAANSNSFINYFGKTLDFVVNYSSAGSFMDDVVGHSYLCISNNLCSPPNFVNNSALFDGSNWIGVFLVRQAGDSSADVPEPASLAILGLGLAGVAATRRRRAK